jgi:DNA modification methylase
MRTFGLISPIIVDGKNNIVAGHARHEAAKRLGLPVVPILRVEHLSQEELRLYAIADNRIAERSGWDERILAIEFQELEIALPEISLSVSGFELPRIEVLTTSLTQTDWSDLDKVDEGDPDDGPITRMGDVWVFDERHRLICGDSTDAQVIAAIMADGPAALMATDAPYNLRAREYSGKGKHKHADFKMGAGELPKDGFAAFLGHSYAAAVPHLSPGALIYSFMDHKHLGELFSAAESNGLERLNICVWDKGKGGMGSFYRSAHEMVCVFKLGGSPHKNRVELGRHGRDRTNIWRYEGYNSFSKGRDRALAMHGTVKPVQMICDLIMDASDRNDIVFDGFGGSGTTLIAAEKMGRRGRLVELDPQYCDTIISRYVRAFGSEPIHRDLGLSYSAVRDLRTSNEGEN